LIKKRYFQRACLVDGAQLYEVKPFPHMRKLRRCDYHRLHTYGFADRQAAYLLKVSSVFISAREVRYEVAQRADAKF